MPKTLKQYRQGVLGLTQRELAETHGISVQRVSQLERGSLPTHQDVRVKWANIYGIPLRQFIELVKAGGASQ